MESYENGQKAGKMRLPTEGAAAFTTNFTTKDGTKMVRFNWRGLPSQTPSTPNSTQIPPFSLSKSSRLLLGLWQSCLFVAAEKSLCKALKMQSWFTLYFYRTFYVISG
jgi:hypothetical protein